jgi:maltose O-acetyltransferase
MQLQIATFDTYRTRFAKRRARLRRRSVEDAVHARGLTDVRDRAVKGVLERVRRFVQYRVRGYVDPDRLVRMGLRLGERVYIAPGTVIDPRHCWLVEIGDESVLGPRVHILAHDASTKPHLGYTKIGEVKIGRRVFIGALAVVLPDVRIGDNAIVGAGAVVRSDVPEGTVALGNPAEVVCSTEEYLDRNRGRMKRRPRFGREGFTYQGGITAGNKQILRDAVRDGTVYVA